MGDYGGVGFGRSFKRRLLFDPELHAIVTAAQSWAKVSQNFGNGCNAEIKPDAELVPITGGWWDLRNPCCKGEAGLCLKP